MIDLFSANTPNGKKISIMLEEISFDYKVIKASDFGLPQHRPRIYMVGFYKPSLKNMFKLKHNEKSNLLTSSKNSSEFGSV